ncbi:hypothetical protein F1880_002869, partial [Penicillium rolfsii]
TPCTDDLRSRKNKWTLAVSLYQQPDSNLPFLAAFPSLLGKYWSLLSPLDYTNTSPWVHWHWGLFYPDDCDQLWTDTYERYAASALSATSLGQIVMNCLPPLSSPELLNIWASAGLGLCWDLQESRFPSYRWLLCSRELKGSEIRQHGSFMKEPTFET